MFISENSKDLAIKSLIFKSQINAKDKTISIFLDSSNEVLIISSNLKKYIDDEQIFNLPIQILERIMSKFVLQSNSLKKGINSEIIDFLFACLDKYGRDASILFSTIDFEQQSMDVVNRLISQYSDVFDFNMI